MSLRSFTNTELMDDLLDDQLKGAYYQKNNL